MKVLGAAAILLASAVAGEARMVGYEGCIAGLAALHAQNKQTGDAMMAAIIAADDEVLVDAEPPHPLMASAEKMADAMDAFAQKVADHCEALRGK